MLVQDEHQNTVRRSSRRRTVPRPTSSSPGIDDHLPAHAAGHHLGDPLRRAEHQHEPATAINSHTE
jgi:hypothetical protein